MHVIPPPKDDVVQSSRDGIEKQVREQGRIGLDRVSNEFHDLRKLDRDVWLLLLLLVLLDEVLETNDRQGVGDLGAAHGAGIVLEKPSVDAGLVEDVIARAPDLVRGRRRDVLQTDRAFATGGVEVAQERRRRRITDGEGAWGSSASGSGAPWHVVGLFEKKEKNECQEDGRTPYIPEK